MRTIEYFAGTGSFSKVARSRGHSIYRIEINKDFEAEAHKSILEIERENEYYDIAWFSPPCTGFSVAAIGKSWDRETKEPKSKSAEEGLELLERTIKLISQGKYIYWFVENPRGMMRKIIDRIFEKYGIKNYKRVTVTYCQYGDKRMKPTDIWTNCKEWIPRSACKNGDKCHERAPRGSRTGTQGMKGAKLRSVIPPALFQEIINNIEGD